jgi:hemoglobin-like flavoprotein
MTTTGADTDVTPDSNAGGLDVAMLEHSFDLIAPQADRVVESFYASLFVRDPALQRLFPDIARQRQSLVATLAVLRRSLRDLSAIVPTLRGLGARHFDYGVQPEHYPVVAEELVAAMARSAGDQWEPRFSTEWGNALTVVASEMLAGAAQSTADRRNTPA